MQKTLQNLQDASDELMMLDDDFLLVPYQIGGVFIGHSQEETQEMLESAKVSVCYPEPVLTLYSQEGREVEYTTPLVILKKLDLIIICKMEEFPRSG